MKSLLCGGVSTIMPMRMTNTLEPWDSKSLLLPERLRTSSCTSNLSLRLPAKSNGAIARDPGSSRRASTCQARRLQRRSCLSPALNIVKPALGLEILDIFVHVLLLLYRRDWPLGAIKRRSQMVFRATIVARLPQSRSRIYRIVVYPPSVS